MCDGFLKIRTNAAKAAGETLEASPRRGRVHLGETFLRRPARHATHRREDLQLARSFVDRCDPRVAIQLLQRVVAHVSRAAQHADRFVRHAVAHFAEPVLRHRRQQRRQALVLLLFLVHLLALLGILAPRPGLFEAVLVVCGERRLIEQRAAGFDGKFHLGQEVRDGRHLLDGPAELDARRRVVPGHPERRLRDAQALGRDADPRPVHQRHDVRHQPAPTLAHQFRGGVVKLHLARRRPVDAHFVFGAADADRRVPLAEEQAQAHAAGLVRLAPREHQQNLPATVRDEPLDAFQAPLAVGILVGLQLDVLEVAARVRLRQDHRPGHRAGAEARQRPLLLVFGSEGVDRLRNALEAEDVHETGVGAADHLDGDGINDARAVQAAEPPRQREPHQVRLRQRL